MGIWNIFNKSVNAKEMQNDSLEEIIKKTIYLMENCNNFKSEAEFLNRINEFTNNTSLAWELYCLIPIAYTRIVITDVQYSDEAILNFSNGKQEKKLLSNMKTYNVINKLVKENINKGKNEKIETILFLSAEFNAIHNAILNGSKIENLVLSPLMLFVPDNYIPSWVYLSLSKS